MAPKWRKVPRSHSCSSGKIRYPTRRIAEAELCRLQQHYIAKGSDVIPTRVHPCKLCDGWHTTSKEYSP